MPADEAVREMLYESAQTLERIEGRIQEIEGVVDRLLRERDRYRVGLEQIMLVDPFKDTAAEHMRKLARNCLLARRGNDDQEAKA